MIGRPTETYEKEKKADTPLVYGLATAYSAAFIILAQYCCLLLFILLGESSALSAVLLFMAAFCLLALLAYTRLEASLTARKYHHLIFFFIILGTPFRSIVSRTGFVCHLLGTALIVLFLRDGPPSCVYDNPLACSFCGNWGEIFKQCHTCYFNW